MKNRNSIGVKWLKSGYVFLVISICFVFPQLAGADIDANLNLHLDFNDSLRFKSSIDEQVIDNIGAT